MARVHQTKTSMKGISAQSGGGAGFKRLTIPDGNSTWRILWERVVTDEYGKEKKIPMYVKDATHFLDMMEGGKNVKKVLHCPRSLYGSVYPVSADQRRCPLCEWVFKNSKSEQDDVKKLVSKYKATERYLVNAMNMDTREIGVLALTWSIWNFITTVSDSPSAPENFDITSPWRDEYGTNIIISKTGKGLSTKYTTKTDPIGATDIMAKEMYPTLPATIRAKYGDYGQLTDENFRAAVEEFIESQMVDLSEIVTPQTVAKYSDLAAAIPNFGDDDYSEPDWADGAGEGDGAEESVQAPTQYNYFDGVDNAFIREHGDVIRDFERMGKSSLYTEAVRRNLIPRDALDMGREELLHKLFLDMSKNGNVEPVPDEHPVSSGTPKDDSAKVASLFGRV